MHGFVCITWSGLSPWYMQLFVCYFLPKITRKNVYVLTDSYTCVLQVKSPQSQTWTAAVSQADLDLYPVDREGSNNQVQEKCTVT